MFIKVLNLLDYSMSTSFTNKSTHSGVKRCPVRHRRIRPVESHDPILAGTLIAVKTQAGLLTCLICGRLPGVAPVADVGRLPSQPRRLRLTAAGLYGISTRFPFHLPIGDADRKENRCVCKDISFRRFGKRCRRNFSRAAVADRFAEATFRTCQFLFRIFCGRFRHKIGLLRHSQTFAHTPMGR